LAPVCSFNRIVNQQGCLCLGILGTFAHALHQRIENFPQGLPFFEHARG